MDMVKVVCGIIYNEEGLVLLCRRHAGKSLAGYWEFPGGKVEAHETPEASLCRELLEELGMKVKVSKHFHSVVHAYDTVTIELVAYLCQFEEATYLLTDHDTYLWVPKHQLLDWQLAPADIPIARLLMDS
jgi:8-oxo-dGTP diphosphatase